MRLTTSPSSESSPAWSPDDRRIAFRRVQAGTVSIVLIPPLGGQERTLAEMTTSLVPGVAAAISSLWTPDGKWLAFDPESRPQDPGVCGQYRQKPASAEG